ncbi:hypothetical protein TERTU_3492 [Teredinibacter turnerae T7901]|uniref:Uncharacterized protein n=1 Tax=Teredinibacter turnerae (strain ATCC 39867 / T7901) TaxID=377629 RepID=C5BRB8_TERTT|nr:hypothetical protein TERTU_3492 [Teredinibacter turnerae T7901]
MPGYIGGAGTHRHELKVRASPKKTRVFAQSRQIYRATAK